MFILICVYLGVLGLLFLTSLLREGLFYIYSVKVQGEVISASRKEHYNADPDDITRPLSTINAMVAFKDVEGKEIVTRAKYDSKRTPDSGDHIAIRFLKRKPSKIKPAQFSKLFSWTILWGIILFFSLVMALLFLVSIDALTWSPLELKLD